MTDEQPTTGAGSGADEPMQLPTDFESVLAFSLGTLDVVRTLCAELIIGLGIIPPDSFQIDIQRLADFWAQKGNPIRREPAAYLIGALKTIEHLKRGNLIIPESTSKN
jgi:hypothetical protein